MQENRQQTEQSQPCEQGSCSKGFKTMCGGQALIEGIMMRGPKKQAVVVRKPRRRAGGPGEGAEAHQGQAPRSGVAPNPGGGQLRRLHVQRGEGPDVLGGVLPRGRGGAGGALQIRPVAGAPFGQREGGLLCHHPGGGAGGGHVHRTVLPAAHPAGHCGHSVAPTPCWPGTWRRVC